MNALIIVDEFWAATDTNPVTNPWICKQLEERYVERAPELFYDLSNQGIGSWRIL